MKKSISFTLFMMLLGAAAYAPVYAQELVYVAVEPCRIADTRKTSIMAEGVARDFQVSGANLVSQGGGSCVQPKAGTGIEPLAASIYMVAVPTGSTGSGWLTAFPSNQVTPSSNSVATVNYAKGQVVGNTTIVSLCPGGCPSGGPLGLVSFNSAQNVVMDIQGYFYPQIVADNTVVVETAYDYGTTYAPISSEIAIATCPDESIMTGGGVWCSADNFNSSTTNFGVINGSFPAGNSYLGSCSADGILYSSLLLGPAITAYAVCAYSTYAASLQVNSASVTTLQAASVNTEVSSQPKQGEPSEEAILLLESLKNKAAAMESTINER